MDGKIPLRGGGADADVEGKLRLPTANLLRRFCVLLKASLCLLEDATQTVEGTSTSTWYLVTHILVAVELS